MLLPSIPCSISIVLLAVWKVGPSCWNHRSWRFRIWITTCFKNILSMCRYISPLNISAKPSVYSKNYRPIMRLHIIAHHTVTRCGYNSFSFNILGFSTPRYLKSCLLTKPFKWKCVSSVINREQFFFLLLKDFNKWPHKLKPFLVIVLTNLLHKLNFVRITL